MTTQLHMTDRSVRDLFGVPVDSLCMGEVLDLVERAVETRELLHIGVVNAAKIVNMQRDEALRSAVMDSSLILADGMSVVWAARLLGRPLTERVAGIDLMRAMLRAAQDRGYRVYFLGARQHVLERAVTRVEQDYPGVSIVGYRHGYFSREEEGEVVKEIQDARPDILFVAMSPPRKEIFLARWSKVLGVPVTHGVGGALDVLAGEVQRAPQRWQRLGLEWLHRVKEEPRRMWRRYLVTNFLFCWLLGLELLHLRRPQRTVLHHG